MTQNYANTTHGLLSVLSRSGTDPEGRAVWACQCACGAPVLATSKQLTKGYKRGCDQCQDSGSKSPLNVRLKKYEIAGDGCWNWTGKRNQNGYGCLRVDGVYSRAHRVMYFMLNPDADRNLVVMHTCDNPRCVNPAHLRLGTQKDNIMDMHKQGGLRVVRVLATQMPKATKDG